MIKIKIANGRDYFYQWDLNQLVTVSGCAHKCRVHFVQDGEPLTVDTTTHEDGTVTAPVPNIMLQQPKPVTCYVYVYDDPADAERYTIKARRFQVHERPKPVDYVYKETEVKTWEALMKAVNTDLSHINEAEALREKAEVQRKTAETKRTERFLQNMDLVEQATNQANTATQNANTAANWAYQAGNAARDTVMTMKDTFSNALKGEQIGAAVKITDLSPVQEYIDVRLTSDTLTDFLPVGVKVLGVNSLRYPYSDSTKTQNGVTFTDNGDGSITISGKAEGGRALFNFSGDYMVDYSHLVEGAVYCLSARTDSPTVPSGISLVCNYYYSTSKHTGWMACQMNGIKTSAYPDDAIGLRCYINVAEGVTFDEPLTVWPQLEVGTKLTSFEQFVEPEPRYPEPDGSFYYFQPVGENITIITDNPEVKIVAKYSRDINKAFAEMYSILQTSGVAALSDPGL